MLKLQTDISLHKIPPHAIEIEESLIVSLLIDKEAIHTVLEKLNPEDFYKQAHREIYSCIIDIHESGNNVDLPTVCEKLNDYGKLESCGGAASIAKMTSEIPIALNIGQYADIVAEKSALRNLIEKSQETINACFSANGSAADVLTTAREEISQVYISKEQSFEQKYNKIAKWILMAPGEFNVLHIDRDFNFKTFHEKIERTKILEKMVKFGEIERSGKNRGTYRPINTDLVEMNFKESQRKSEPLWLPFNIHRTIKTFPGNIIQISGEKNAGKTALMLNIIQGNRKKYKVHYFNSEMGEDELSLRLSLFKDMTLDMWNFNAYERSSDFASVIKPGKGNLNIIDFLEVHDEFYKMGQFMRDIHDRLDGAIAIVAVQKNTGNDMGLGGSRTEEKPRLILTVAPGKIKIKMAKNWHGENNPNGLCVDFKLVSGCNFIQTNDWYREM